MTPSDEFGGTLSGAQVLVIDDEPGMRNFLVKILEPRVKRVSGAGSPAEATRALTHLTFAAARRVVGLTEVPPAAPPLLSLQWPSGTGGTEGVEVGGDEVLWWSRPGGSGGRFGEAARGQSVEDYRQHGPAVSCPPEVERQVDAALGR